MLTANMLAMERERAALSYSNAHLLGGPLGYHSGLVGSRLGGLSGLGGLGLSGGLGYGLSGLGRLPLR